MQKIKEIIKKLVGKKVISVYHFLWVYFACFIYRNPSNKMKTIAITGTKGKTSTAFILWHILNSAGIKTGLLSTAVWSFDGKNIQANKKHMTMPGRSFIQKSLHKMLKNNCKIAIIETTSEGILQYRHKCINPNYTIFTNLYKDHIESHGSFENYKKTKGLLFKENKDQVLIANKDDKYFDYFADFHAKEKISYGKTQNANMQIKDISIDHEKTKCIINDTNFTIPLVGEFFCYNLAAAIAVATHLNIPKDKIKKALQTLPNIPGRMQKINIKTDFNIFIDYAHEQESLKQALSSVKKITKGKLIVVFGATGGNRDKSKRPEMGNVADQLADIIILTDDDPYDEDSEKIMQEIKKGIKKHKENIDLFLIEDRKEAIKKAINLARHEDTIIIAGKGAETEIIKKGKKIPHNDKEFIEDLLR